MRLFAMRLQVWQQGNQTVNDAAHVHGHVEVPVLEGGRGHGANDPYAGVVHQHMDITEAGLHFGHGVGPACAVGHIQQHGHHLMLRREITHGFFERLFAQVRNSHLHARLGERDGHAEAHAAGSTRD